jgi:hypothetical protein
MIAQGLRPARSRERFDFEHGGISFTLPKPIQMTPKRRNAKRLSLGASLLLAALATLPSACSKEMNVFPSKAGQYDPTPRIVAFLRKAQEYRSAPTKSSESLMADSAVWYVEAALNFSFGNLAKPYTWLVNDTLHVPLVGEDNCFQATAVQEAFNELADVIAPMTTDEQHVSLVDIIEPPEGATEIMAIVILAQGYNKAAPNSTYGPKDWYNYGLYNTATTLCGCEPAPQQPRVVFCANKIIEQRINAANLSALNPDEYITDVETWKIRNYTVLAAKELNPLLPLLAGPAPLGDGYRDSKTYTWRINTSSPNPQICLSPTEMTFWTQGTWSAITTIRSTYCPTKTFLNCTMIGFAGPLEAETSGSLAVWYWHFCDFRYGRIVGSNG